MDNDPIEIWTKIVNRQFTDKENQTAAKHMEAAQPPSF